MSRGRVVSRLIQPWVPLVLLALLAFSPPEEAPSRATANGEYAAAVIHTGDEERRLRHLPQVLESGCLQEAAEKQAQDMARRKDLYHQDMQAVLIRCNLHEVGENVAFGYAGGADVTAAWMHSATHRRNLLSANHRRIGVGASQDSNGDWYVSQVLGLEARAVN